MEVAIEAANRLGMRPEFVFSDWITARDSLIAGNADVRLGLEIFSNMKGVEKTIPISNDSIDVMALIYTDYKKMPEIKNEFYRHLEKVGKQLQGGISIACGYASHVENAGLSIEELELYADKNMYHEKAEHYKNSKFDRRGL